MYINVYTSDVKNFVMIKGMQDKPLAGPLILNDDTDDTDDARQPTVGLVCAYRQEGSLVVAETQIQIKPRRAEPSHMLMEMPTGCNF